VWKESGGTAVAEPARQGFGMQVLTGMLSYELNARVDLAFEEDGLRCAIRFPVVPRIGRLVEESRPDEAAEPD
jgi:two-component sensor histidine kinase